MPLLKLESYHFSLLHIEANRLAENRIGGLIPNIAVGWSESPQQGTVVVTLEIRNHNPDGVVPMYDVHLRIAGAFKVNGEPNELQIAQYGAATLIGPLREMVALMTARSVNGTLFIPLIDFEDLQEGPADLVSRLTPAQKAHTH